jgi:hypothetical protein
MSTPLTCKVNAVNAANKAANEYYRLLTPAFEPFAGKTVLKADGRSFTARVKAALPELPWGADLSVSVHADYRSAVHVRVRAAAADPAGLTHYHTAEVALVKLADGVAGETVPAESLREDYTVDEIREARAAADKWEKGLRAAERKLGPFGRYDR